MRFAFWTSSLAVLGLAAFLLLAPPRAMLDVILMLAGVAGVLFVFGLPRRRDRR